MNGPPFSAADDRLIIREYQKKQPQSVIAQMLGRPRGSVHSRIHRLVRQGQLPIRGRDAGYRHFAPEEDQVITQGVAAEESMRAIARKLGRSSASVQHRVGWLQKNRALVMPDARGGRHFTAKEDRLLLKLKQQGAPWAEIATALHRNVGSVKYRYGERLRPAGKAERSAQGKQDRKIAVTAEDLAWSAYWALPKAERLALKERRA